jgi:two-component system, chemotaxis family, CheB/CheR fusion protein
MTDALHDDAPTRPHPATGARAPALFVGIGASAGGIRALKDFFAHVPASTGAAYIVIVHLSPDHDSRLAEVLQAITVMPVTQVRGEITMEADHIYVVAPNQSLTVAGATLMLADVARAEQRRAAVDLFFRALAEAHGSHCVSIVLSGTGADGSSGLKRTKEHGGLAIAQDPREAEFADMPNNSIATGLVDRVLPVAAMPSAIVEYYRRLGSTEAIAPSLARGDDGEPLRGILTLLRVRTGQDFSNYKRQTVRRRIERRLSLHSLSTLAEYHEFMREHADEAKALMKELLISVTNFFRDAEAFALLAERVLPRLFEQKQSQDQVRVWVPGCATGEEAYSVAMLLTEFAAAAIDPPSIQVFATDLDADAIAVAREAHYTEAEVADVSEERLQRFFQHERGGYRVRRDLRELVLFAPHNVIKDPPFSHLDLITCRNLMIYLNRPIQERLFETFHFALRPGGFLLLGTSESPDGTSDLFVSFDNSAHLYQSRSVATRLALPPIERIVGPAAVPPRPELRAPERMAPAELHQRLLEQYAAPSLVVTDAFNIAHVSESAAQYLQLTGGEPSRDLLKLIRPELRAALRMALHQAAQQRANVEVRGVEVTLGEARTPLTIVVRPVLGEGDPARGYFLILFDQTDTAPREGVVPVASVLEPLPRHLEEELTRVKEHLRGTIEQYETQVEEAKASNEELQATNEELRSAAEELETSKEELQSVNEELTTVNQELKIKIEELGLTNNDFYNFINSTDIGTIFLDRALRVKLSTRRAQDVFNLLPTDVGRRLSDITSTLVYDRLDADIREVLERLHTIEREVRTREGRWWLMRVLPYRTTDDRIDGVVITFLDITGRRTAEMRVSAGEERLRLLIDSAIDYAIFTMTDDGLIDSWNTGAERMFGYPASNIIGRSGATLFTPEDRADGVPDRELEQARRAGRADAERFHLHRDGTRFYCSGVTTKLGDALGFAKIARDLTAQRDADVALKHAHATLEERVRDRTRELEAEVARRASAQDHVMSLLRKLVTSQEDQRARIARDLHDQLGQQLTALRLTLERHRERCTLHAEGADEDLDRALALGRGIDDEMDFLAWELRPAALDDLGLVAALPRFLETWSKHYGLAADFQSTGFTSGRLSLEAEVTFYRITQEALNNVIKHAHASRVNVILENRDGSVILVVEDDGVGFDLGDRTTAEKGLGLMGMHERASLIGATLEIESAPGNGTTIFVRCSASTCGQHG